VEREGPEGRQPDMQPEGRPAKERSTGTLREEAAQLPALPDAPEAGGGGAGSEDLPHDPFVGALHWATVREEGLQRERPPARAKSPRALIVNDLLLEAMVS
jgi:hypothetical protein